MKRVRVEGEELRPWRRAQAQLASHNLEPAAATQSGTSHGRQVLTSHGRALTWDDAHDFTMSVRREVSWAKYREFLNVISRVESIGVRGIVDRMKVVLRGYPELKRHFNMFVPVQYRLSLRDDDDQQEEASAADCLQGRPTQRD